MIALIVFITVLVVLGGGYLITVNSEGYDDAQYARYDNTHRGFIAYIYDVGYNNSSDGPKRANENRARNAARRERKEAKING